VSESKAALYKALLAAQQEMPAIHRDTENPHLKNKYVSLDQILDKVVPVLNKHGLVLWQAPVNVGAGPPILRTVLAHGESGEEIEVEFALNTEGNQRGMQAVGSAITYGRRYALTAMFALITDEDDDGNASSRQAEPKQEQVADDGGLPGYEEPKATAKQTKEFVEVAQGLLDGGAVTQEALETAMGWSGPWPAVAKTMSGPKTADLTEKLIRHRDHLLAEQAAEAAAKDA
jgi:hypothetical protein